MGDNRERIRWDLRELPYVCLAASSTECITVMLQNLAEAEAQQELLMLDSRVLGTTDEYFLDRFRRRGIVHQDVLAQLAKLLTETRMCGGRIIRLGRILTNEILEFIEREPDLPPGPQLTVALHTLIDFAPLTAPSFAPLVTEADSQGYGRAMAATGFMDDLDRKARIFFRRFADILNLNRGFLAGLSAIDLNVATVEEPPLFELDTADDPFDLDDVNSMSPATKMVVKFLVKIAVATGHFTDEEKQFIAKVLSQTGESITQSQFEHLTAEAARESLETILRPMEHQAEPSKERLLLAGMLLSASDGHVEKIEKKVLAQALPVLGISRARYSEIAKDALSLIRSGRLASAQTALTPIREEETGVALPRPSSLTNQNDTPSPESTPNRRSIPATPPVLPPPPQEQNSREPQGATQELPEPVPEKTPAAQFRNRPASQESAKIRQPTAIVWRCPSCNMPQFRAYDVCPQCGVIVSKFQKLHLWGQAVPCEEQFLDVPDDSSDEVEEAPNDSSQPEPQINSVPVCPSCNAVVSQEAKFCTSCGQRIR